ncbi:hypothetical protein BDZ97DRAFT_1939737 [Flammula alnicola]|nr:hypothetical protein BDZ97DRAFT_1939737 [Flammula alnicola]
MVARPPLPVRFANPNIKEHLNAPHMPPVKYQILNCQGKDILVRTLFVLQPFHAHKISSISRSEDSKSRHQLFDTGAISLTTMFQKIEIQWVRENYDLSGNNGSTKDTHITRLAGTWVSPQVALELGKAYALGEIINAVVDASPDPNGNYRRSGKAAGGGIAVAHPPFGATTVTTAAQTTTTTTSSIVVSKPPSAAKSLPTPSPTAANPPAKRRKESSPVPTPQSSKPPSRAPAPRSVAATVVNRTPKATRSAKKEAVAATSLTPGEDGVAGSELREEDIKEQQRLIKDLKSKRDAAKSAAEEGGMDVGEESSKKREREEEDKPLQFTFKEPEAEERAIATNRRGQSFAWGIAAFAVGMGAV